MIKEIVEKDQIDYAMNHPESIAINDDEMRDAILERATDMVNLSVEDFCAKYDIVDRTYRNWKRQLVTVYGVEPRMLYSGNRALGIKELSPYIDNEKYKLPLSQQITMPVTVENIGNYNARKKTIQIRGDGTVTQVWLKYEQKQQEFHEQCKRAILEICKDKVKPLPPIKSPKMLDDDLLTFYPLPDLHWGMLICREEVNHNMNYDLKIAKEWIETSFHYLVERAPKSKYAVITDLGDFLHAQDDTQRTKHGHVLDVDQRHSKIIRVAFEAMRRMIEEALKKHEKVYFYSIAGNHSEYAPIYLKEFLQAWFKDNPRLIIPDSYRAQQYHIFGKNILGFSHGHELKPEKSPEVLAYDNKDAFSQSDYRYFHFGHFHQAKAFNSPLVNVEIHNNLPPRDRWAESMGFRGNIGISKAIVYHRNYGEISRFNFNLPIELPNKVVNS